jgi:di/tricarboxylate transporter
MLATRCTSLLAARRAVDFQVIILIAAALGLGGAMASTGAAAGVARAVLEVAGDRPLAVLAVLYAITVVFTEVIGHAAAAVLMFPLVVTSAAGLGVDAMPFAVAIMLAASLSFLTPIGYQTNLMVYGPGGYRFGDYARVGAPLTLLLGAVSLAIIPRVWPF